MPEWPVAETSLVSCTSLHMSIDILLIMFILVQREAAHSRVYGPEDARLPITNEADRLRFDAGPR
jgi:hypothetical protein